MYKVCQALLVIQILLKRDLSLIYFQSLLFSLMTFAINQNREYTRTPTEY